MANPGGYVIGQVASLLSGSTSTSKPESDEKQDKRERKKRKLESLFSVSQNTSIQRGDENAERGVSDGFCPPPGIVHESMKINTTQQTGMKRKAKDDSSKSSETEEMRHQKRLRKDRRDKTNDDRTVFVGNLPTNVTKKDVKRLFKKFGEIDTIRIRCAPRADLKVPKKLAVIKKEFHPERHNLAAYVVFRNTEDAQKATSLNGDLFVEGFHMRVDLASKDRVHDHQRSVFVGNLPYDVQENDVWRHFQEYGQVENVRLIRDRNTSIGKGFGYVLFSDKSSVSLTLKFGKHQFKGRELRVKRSTDHPVKAIKDEAKGHQSARTRTRPKFKKASNITSHSFQGDKASKKKSKKPLGHRKINSSSKGLMDYNKRKSGKPKKQVDKTGVGARKRGATKTPGQTGKTKKQQANKGHKKYQK